MKRIILLALLFLGSLASSSSLGAQDSTKAKQNPLAALQKLFGGDSTLKFHMRLGNIDDQAGQMPNRDSARAGANPLQALQELHAQRAGKVDGYVRGVGGTPIVGAVVTIVGLGSTTTNKEGYYFFNSVPAGTYTLTAFADGFQPQKVDSFRVTEGETRRADFMQAVEGSMSGGRATPVKQASQPLTLRFQLLSPTTFKTKDPAMAGLDSILNDVLKFPGYRLVSQAAIAVDYEPTPRYMAPTATSQLLRNGTQEYRLTAAIDSVTSQGVRVEVVLESPQEIVTRQTPEGKNVETVTKMGRTLFRTKLTVSFGSTVVLGTTQAGPAASTAGSESTLILTVRPELRKP